MERAALVVAGLAVGVLIAAAAVTVLDDGDGAPPLERRPVGELAFPALEHDPAAAADLLAAWQRWRHATFITSGTWSRQLDAGGDPLIGPSYRVQDPPRRLVIRLGSTVERIDESISVCDAADEGFDAPECVGGAASLSYEERVASEMLLVGAYIEGAGRLYDVAAGEIDGCFQAEIEVAALTSPWGRWAEFCFDHATGALVSSRVRRPSAVDVEDLRVVSDSVTEADFAPAE